jgi:phage terminase small subunit
MKGVQMAKSAKSRGLNKRQRLFIEEYLACWNATEAARRAGYSRAAWMGWHNLKHPVIHDEIQRRLDERAMAANEVLALLADHARGSFADFLVRDPQNNLILLDLDKAELRGKLHLIKKITIGKESINLELHDAQNALVQLARYHQLLSDRADADWRQEVRLRGGDPDLLFEQLSEQIDQHMAQGRLALPSGNTE